MRSQRGTDGVWGRLTGPRARVPRALADLRGPRQGIVVLPGHLTWHGYREFDVSAAEARLLLYSIVLSQGSRADLARYLNAGWLREDWPLLRDLVSRRTRQVAERRFGLRGLPAGPRRALRPCGCIRPARDMPW